MTEASAEGAAPAGAATTQANAAAAMGGDEPGIVHVSGPSGSAVHHLLHPLMVDGERVDTVTVRPATLGDVDDWGSGVLKSNRDLLSRLTGLSPAVLRALRWADAEAVIRLFEAAVPPFVIEGIEGRR